MKKFLHQIIVHILLFFFAQLSFAQEGTVTGTIYGTEGVLQKATISVGSVIILSDNLGKFSLSIEAGNHTLHITHVGYRKISQEVNVKAGNIVSLSFTLVPDEIPGEPVVLGSRSNLQRSNLSTPVPVDVISSRLLLQTGQTNFPAGFNFSV